LQISHQVVVFLFIILDGKEEIDCFFIGEFFSPVIVGFVGIGFALFVFFFIHEGGHLSVVPSRHRAHCRAHAATRFVVIVIVIVNEEIQISSAVSFVVVLDIIVFFFVIFVDATRICTCHCRCYLIFTSIIFLILFFFLLLLRRRYLVSYHRVAAAVGSGPGAAPLVVVRRALACARLLYAFVCARARISVRTRTRVRIRIRTHISVCSIGAAAAKFGEFVDFKIRSTYR
jgi:hypothetical protein